MGESEDDRIAMLMTLANLDPHPESVPINALVPVHGTPLENQSASKRVGIRKNDRDRKNSHADIHGTTFRGKAPAFAGSSGTLLPCRSEFHFRRRQIIDDSESGAE